MIIGPPAAGKSTVTKSKEFKDYVIACQDDLGTKAKVIKTVRNALKNGKSQDAIIFSMADNAEAMNAPDKAISLLTRYRKHLSPTGRIRADARVADLCLSAGNSKKATTYRKRAYQAYSPILAKKDDAMRSAVARMVFNSVDRYYTHR